jgi:teichuronic acid biosynthesis glycosyltransferase TuaC
MSIKNICFIVPGYPTKNDPQFTFVAELIHAIADCGINCTVFATQSITHSFLRKKKPRPVSWFDKTQNGNKISIYQPKVISFSNLNVLGWSISAYISKYAILKAFQKISPDADILYAHFWNSGVVAGEIADKHEIPFVVATGESKIWVTKQYPDYFIKKCMNKLSGVISVSTKNLRESWDLGLGNTVQSIILPNAINVSKFIRHDKQEMRKKLNFPQNAFIISFTGAFIERKGPLRLQEAVRRIGDPAVKVIYIGDGPQKPQGEDVLFSGRLPHERVVEYLCSSDIFVLPTLAEGCSNAIVEALACGLPVVSSDLAFNHDILDETSSILIDPLSIKGLHHAITQLYIDEQLRKRLSNGAEQCRNSLDISQRAASVLQFIEKCV